MSGSRQDQPADAVDGIVPPQVPLSTRLVVEVGLALWVAVLVVVLAVPELRSGERSWWLWVPVAALVTGALGYGYLRRGRGNARGG